MLVLHLVPCALVDRFCSVGSGCAGSSSSEDCNLALLTRLLFGRRLRILSAMALACSAEDSLATESRFVAAPPRVCPPVSRGGVALRASWSSLSSSEIRIKLLISNWVTFCLNVVSITINTQQLVSTTRLPFFFRYRPSSRKVVTKAPSYRFSFVAWQLHVFLKGCAAPFAYHFYVIIHVA